MFTENGLITKQGIFVSCEHAQHITVMGFMPADCFPVVACRGGDTAEFEAWYTVAKSEPTQAQFETLMDWCTAMGEKFENVTDCWHQPWQKWLVTPA